jgi:peptidyl-tRNA hydrolase
VAAKLRRDLGIDVDMVHGRYGEYQVLVDGQTVIDGGALTALGIVPARRKVVEAVRARLSSSRSRMIF